MTTKDRLAFAAALATLLATGCGRISDPVASSQAQTMAAPPMPASIAGPSYFERSSARIDPAARDGAVFEYH